VPSSEPHPKLKPLPTLGNANGCFDVSTAHRLALCGYFKKQVKLVISAIFVLIDRKNATGYPQFSPILHRCVNLAYLAAARRGHKGEAANDEFCGHVNKFRRVTCTDVALN
jgi:hypothetical protein